MKLAVTLVAVALAAGSGSALAQPGTVTPAPAPAPAPPAPYGYGYQEMTPIAPPAYEQVSEDVALGLSLGGTVASYALLIVGGATDNPTAGMVGAIGTLFAPSLGHWYSHHYFSRGMGLRLAGIGTEFVGIAMALGSIDSETDNGDGAALVMLAGAGLYIAGTVDDIATAPSAARDYNHRFQDVHLVPVMNPHGGGMGLIGRF
jgi:hypothetical protein